MYIYIYIYIYIYPSLYIPGGRALPVPRWAEGRACCGLTAALVRRPCRFLCYGSQESAMARSFWALI